MISLFHIPDYIIDTSKFTNRIHGDIVDMFTENFCNYVGIKYGCPVDCATNAIFLVACRFPDLKYKIPTMITPVVPQALINAKVKFDYIDDTSWVGYAYLLHHYIDSYNENKFDIVDSAQAVQKWNLNKNDIVVFSFYPTKPVGSSDGGMICSNNKELIDYFRIMSVQGTVQDSTSWNGRRYVNVGWKMYLNSFQAYIANENLKKLDEKKTKLNEVATKYNHAFGINNNSHHLYRIKVNNNRRFLQYMKSNDIVCGIHYECCHTMPPFNQNISLPHSEELEHQTVSIPFHEKLTDKEIIKVIRCIKASNMLII